MSSGTVKWFDLGKGYGFIVPDSGGSDVFVHISAVHKAGFNGLVEGVKVEFDVVCESAWRLPPNRLPAVTPELVS
jgi:CspA family cold shock protein